jgi:trigger factor
MQIQRTNLSTTELKLTISATAAEMAPIKDQVVSRLSKNIKIPGFRTGKAPIAMAEKHLDQNLLQGDFLDEAMTQLYAQATTEHNIRPVTKPTVDIKKFVPYTDLEFEVTTSIISDIKLGEYKNLKVKREEVKVTADDVNEVLKTLQQRIATKEVVARPAKDGDEAIIDFAGVDAEGKAIAGAEGTDYPLTLGSNTFIPGFEENITGMKTGEEKSFEVTFPSDYSAKHLAGTKVTFNVTLKTVNKLVKPALDDTFAPQVGPFKTLDELKEDIKKQITHDRQHQAQNKYQEDVLRVISENTTVDIPQALIEQQVVYNIDELRRNLTYRGQTYQEYLETEGKTEEEYKKELEPLSRDQLKASLVISEIANVENVTVEPEEIEAKIAELRKQYTDAQMQNELDKPENRRDIASRLISDKVIALITK